jgi:hypothetical protein
MAGALRAFIFMNPAMPTKTKEKELTRSVWPSVTKTEKRPGVHFSLSGTVCEPQLKDFDHSVAPLWRLWHTQFLEERKRATAVATLGPDPKD